MNEYGKLQTFNDIMGDEDYTRMEEIANLLGWQVFFIDISDPDTIPVFYKGILLLDDLRKIVNKFWSDIELELRESGDNRKIDQFIQDQFRILQSGKPHEC